MKEMVSLLFEEDSKKITGHREKTELLSFYFAFIFSQKGKIVQSMGSVTMASVRRQMNVKIVKAVMSEHRAALNKFMSQGPGGLHPRKLKDLENVISAPLTIIFENSWGLE